VVCVGFVGVGGEGRGGVTGLFEKEGGGTGARDVEEGRRRRTIYVS